MQVKITDMQVMGPARELLPGDPLCATIETVLVESNINLIRSLHKSDVWTDDINQSLIDRLNLIPQLKEEEEQVVEEPDLIHEEGNKEEEKEIKEKKEEKEDPVDQSEPEGTGLFIFSGFLWP